MDSAPGHPWMARLIWGKPRIAPFPEKGRPLGSPSSEDRRGNWKVPAFLRGRSRVAPRNSPSSAWEPEAAPSEKSKARRRCPGKKAQRSSSSSSQKRTLGNGGAPRPARRSAGPSDADADDVRMAALCKEDPVDEGHSVRALLTTMLEGYRGSKPGNVMAAGRQAEILRTCVRAILRFDTEPGGNCTEMQIWKVEEAFQILLRGFVRSRPSNEHLLYLLGHFDICLACGGPKAKALANRSCFSLLNCAAAQPTVEMQYVLASVFNRSYWKPASPVQ